MFINNIKPISYNIYNKVPKNHKPINKKPVTPLLKPTEEKPVFNAMLTGTSALFFKGISYNKKNISKPARILKEHINFKDAKTLNEAINFGINNLGIQAYKGFKQNDLDVINWINEGLVNINNVTKGKAFMPRKIILGRVINGGAGMNEFCDILFDKKTINTSKDICKKFIERLGDIDIQLPSCIYEESSLIKRAKLLFNLIDERILEKNEVYSGSIFSQISHEMGHVQHFNNLKSSDLFYQIGSYDLSKTILSRKGRRLWDLFNDKKDVARKVSDYATITPVEFVAECYAKMVDGIKLDDDVVDLYQKLGGVMI